MLYKISVWEETGKTTILSGGRIIRTYKNVEHKRDTSPSQLSTSTSFSHKLSFSLCVIFQAFVVDTSIQQFAFDPLLRLTAFLSTGSVFALHSTHFQSLLPTFHFKTRQNNEQGNSRKHSRIDCHVRHFGFSAECCSPPGHRTRNGGC
jgi:hypothetical protein